LTVLVVFFLFSFTTDHRVNPKADHSKPLTDVELYTTKDGAVLLFEKKGAIYKNAFTFLLDEGKNKNELLRFLKSDELSYEYHKNYIHLYGDAGMLDFVVNNETGNSFIQNNTPKHFIFGNQLALLSGNRFNPGNITGNSIGYRTLELVKNLMGQRFNEDCNSGGEGAVSCEIGDTFSHCSVSCGKGYDACCDDVNTICTCKKKE